MFIIDFDDTLFDTQSFKQARLEAVQRLGVSEEEFWETYRQARNSADGAMTYSDDRHAEVLAARGYNHDEVLTMLRETTGAAIKNFLFDDTMAFLQRIKKLGQPMILLSLGNPGFQELKTKGSGVDRYFDRVIFVHDTKQHVLQKLSSAFKGSASWFINDKAEETKKIARAFPALKPILKISERFTLKEYEESGLLYFGSLTEVAEYVERGAE